MLCCFLLVQPVFLAVHEGVCLCALVPGLVPGFSPLQAILCLVCCVALVRVLIFFRFRRSPLAARATERRGLDERTRTIPYGVCAVETLGLVALLPLALHVR